MNAPGGPPHNNEIILSSPFSIIEYCKRIQDEFHHLENHCAILQQQLIKSEDKQKKLEEESVKLSETHFRTISKMDKQIKDQYEINRSLIEFLKRLNTHLNSELQEEVKKAIYQVTSSFPPLTQLQSDGLQLLDNTVCLSSVKSEASIPDLINEKSTKKPRLNTPVEKGRISVEPRESSSPIPMEDESSQRKRSKTPSGKMTPSPVPLTGFPKSLRVHKMVSHEDGVSCVLFNRNGNSLLTGTKGFVKLWDIKNNSEIMKFNIPCLNRNFVRSLCLIGESEENLLVSGESNVVEIWNLETQKPFKTPFQIGQGQNCFSVISNFPQSNICFGGCSDGMILAWDLTSSTQVLSLRAHSSSVSSIAISPDGTKLISSGLDGNLKFWDIIAGKELGTINFLSPLWCFQVCPGESWITVGQDNGYIESLNTISPNQKYQIQFHEGSVLSLKYHPSGKWFTSIGKDKFMSVWRSPYGPSVYHHRDNNIILCSDVSENYIAAGSRNKVATIYEVSMFE